MPHATLRNLYHIELKILKTIGDFKPTGKTVGCPLKLIAETCIPDPVHECVSFMMQERLIEEPIAPQGHHYTDKFVLTQFGNDVLQEYVSGEKKSVARPGLPKNNKQLREEAARVAETPAQAETIKNAPKSKEPKPMLSLAGGTTAVGEGHNHLADGGGKASRSVKGRGAANAT
jgi:hypothetical protein